MLPTGKLLLIAGSGNDRKLFQAGEFKTLVYDPETGNTKLVMTPGDVFCGGHTYLPDGNLLVAGGTRDYEVLQPDATRAGGPVKITNTGTDPMIVTKGAMFVSKKTGKKFRSDAEITIPPVEITKSGKRIPGTRNVWVDSVLPGSAGTVDMFDRYKITSFSTDVSSFLYGDAGPLKIQKKDYSGIRNSYEFNPFTEKYERVGDLEYARWYPTLTGLPDGHVMAFSGLDEAGQILQGQTEEYLPRAKKWIERRDLRQYFATYPAIFSTTRPNTLFYAGANSGYGSPDLGRTPGFWDLTDNTFTKVPGMRDADQLETAGATWAGPVNDQKIMVVGGGGQGESPHSTGRIDIVDLKAAAPRFSPAAMLPDGTRYPSLSQLPGGDVLITGGSRDYRGKGGSDIKKTYIYRVATGKLDEMAEPNVGRDYHSSSVLLPTGQVMTIGSDPLYADAEGTRSGKFEKRLEIYTPNFLFRADGNKVVRPTITAGPEQLNAGEKATFTIGSTDNSVPKIASVRLMFPSAVTHMTDPNQRSVDIGFEQQGSTLRMAIPHDRALLPRGYYMIFLNDVSGVPSIATWVKVV